MCYSALPASTFSSGYLHTTPSLHTEASVQILHLFFVFSFFFFSLFFHMFSLCAFLQGFPLPPFKGFLLGFCAHYFIISYAFFSYVFIIMHFLLCLLLHVCHYLFLCALCFHLDHLASTPCGHRSVKVAFHLCCLAAVFCFLFFFSLWVVLFHPLFLRSLVFLTTSRHQPTTMPSGFLSSSIYIHVFSSASLETRGPLPVTRCNLVNKCLSLFFSTLSFCQSFLPFFVLFSVWLGLGSRSLRSRGLINLT